MPSAEDLQTVVSVLVCSRVPVADVVTLIPTGAERRYEQLTVSSCFLREPLIAN